MQAVVDDLNGLSDTANLKRCIEGEGCVRIQQDVGALIAGKTGRLHGQFIMANWQHGEGVMSLAVCMRLVREPLGGLTNAYFRVWDHAPCRVFDRARDTATHAGPGE